MRWVVIGENIAISLEEKRISRGMRDYSATNT